MPAKPVLSICLKGFPGANQVLVNLSQTSGLTQHVTLASPDPASLEVCFLAEHIRERRPKLVIFGGWSPSYQRMLELVDDSTSGLAVYWTSSPGQTDLSQEVEKLVAVLVEPRIRWLLFCSPIFAEVLSQQDRARAHYLPPTLHLPEPTEQARPAESETVTLFCAAAEYRRKNVLNCLLALAGLRGSYRLLVNGLSVNPHYLVVLERLGLPYEDLGWLERPAYEAVLKTAALGLQISYSESYCYVAAEQLALGVPVIGSPMVPVIARLSAELRRWLVASADDVQEIRGKIQYLLDHPATRAELGARARDELIAANRADVKQARHLLRELIAAG